MFPVRVLFFLTVFISSLAWGQTPQLREEVLLNGNWPVGGMVPQYAGIEHLKEQSFERDVLVPAGWADKRTRLEFGAINFIAEVYVDGKKVCYHVGGWNPFEVDVTNVIQPGKSFRLKVVVSGPGSRPVSDGNGSFLWPVGGWSNRGGIADDVWLRAYGNVYIDDAFVQTSYRKSEIAVEYTIINTTTREQMIEVVSDVSRANGRHEAFTLPGKSVAIKAGDTMRVMVSGRWKNPELWWPNDPVLHHLTTRLMVEGKSADAETTRFGFREFWIEGNQFRLNGVRINLYGDYQSFASTYYTRPEIHTPENWPATIDSMKAMNIRILRFHHNPVPQYILNIADEKGLLICDESAHYGRKYLKTTDRDRYIENGKAWLRPWIKADRNHPSVYMWNATNEMTYDFVLPFTEKEILGFGDEIRKLDTTRAVGYDGDREVGDALIDLHYPEGYNKEPVGSIYSWAGKVLPHKPTGSGELLHTKSPLPEVQQHVERNTWWLGIWLRGMRYTNWTNVKPACYWFTGKDLQSPDSLRRVRSVNLRNAYAPVALFDKAYDDLGIDPFVTGTTPVGVLPSLEAGSLIIRQLVLYNDEFQDDQVTAEVSVEVNGREFSKVKKAFRLAPGEHLDLQCKMQVPDAAGKQLALIFRTYKKGKKTFEEGKRFHVLKGSTNVIKRTTKMLLSSAR